MNKKCDISIQSLKDLCSRQAKAKDDIISKCKI